MKPMFGLLSWIAGIVVLLSVALVVINLFDEDLDPAAQAALDRGFTVKDTANGFFVVAGLFAPRDKDAHVFGRTLVSNWSKEDEKPHWQRDYGDDPDTANFAGMVRKVSPNSWCDWNEQKCLASYLEHREQIEKTARDGAILLERYQSILEYPSYQDYMPGTVQTPMPHYLGIIWAAGVHNAQCALLVNDGRAEACLKLLAQDVEIARKMLAGGRTILGKMVPIVLLNHDYRLLGEILSADNSVANAQSAEISTMLTPLTAQELDFSQALLEGFITAPSLLREAQEVSETRMGMGSSSTPEALRLLGNTVSRVFLKINATLNLDYRQRELLIDQSRLSAREYRDRLDEYNDKAAAMIPRKFNVGMIYNPIGKIMLAVALPDYPTYLFRVHDLNGLQRLVRMQWQILERGVTPEMIPAFLMGAGTQGWNPYTEQPLDWEAATRTLSFTPMEQRRLIPGGRYEVKI